jgi:hypothetical protein
VPRYRAPAVLEALRRSGARVETGRTDHDRHQLEVFVSNNGAELLEQHGITTRVVKRGPPTWPDPRDRLVSGAGRAAFLDAHRPAASPDPLERPVRRANRGSPASASERSSRTSSSRSTVARRFGRRRGAERLGVMTRA